MQRSLNDQEVGKLVVQVNASGIFGQGVVRIWKKLKVLPSGNYSRFSEKEKDSNQVIILNYHRNGTVNDYHQSVIQYSSLHDDVYRLGVTRRRWIGRQYI